MLPEKQRKVIELYFEGGRTMQQIAHECGYKNRASVYDILEKPEAKEYIKQLGEAAVKEAVNHFKTNAKKMAQELIQIAQGNFDDGQLVYARINAIKAVLEMAGINTKNVFVFEDNRDDQEDVNELLDMLDRKKAKKKAS